MHAAFKNIWLDSDRPLTHVKLLKIDSVKKEWATVTKFWSDIGLTMLVADCDMCGCVDVWMCAWFH